jgi:hypothetical protein
MYFAHFSLEQVELGTACLASHLARNHGTALMSIWKMISGAT